MIEQEHGTPFLRPAVVEAGWPAVAKVAAWVPIGHEVATGSTVYASGGLSFLGGIVRPWERPDRNPFPTFTIWPAFDRAAALAAEVRERITDAVDVLRHGLPE